MDPLTLERRPRTYLAIGAVAVVVAAVAIAAYVVTRPAPDSPVAAVGSAPPTLTVSGTLRLDGVVGPLWKTGATCAGRSGYADIIEGAQVVVTDPAGKTVGLGSLAHGVVIDHPDIQGAKTCRFDFVVPAVPMGLGTYGVEVSHRGRLQFREADMPQVQLTLG